MYFGETGRGALCSTFGYELLLGCPVLSLQHYQSTGWPSHKGCSQMAGVFILITSWARTPVPQHIHNPFHFSSIYTIKSESVVSLTSSSLRWKLCLVYHSWHFIWIEFDRSHVVHSASSILLSSNLTVMGEYLGKEVALSRMWKLPYNHPVPNIHLSPMGVIPKKNKTGKWHLIVDLSSPWGFSVNDGISSDMSSITYTAENGVARPSRTTGCSRKLHSLRIWMHQRTR